MTTTTAETTWCRACGGTGEFDSGEETYPCGICDGRGEHPTDLEYGVTGTDEHPPVHYPDRPEDAATISDTSSTSPAAEPITITVRPMNVPAKKLPGGLWIDVLAVLKAHGLDAAPSEVVSALSRIVRHTPVEQGGRLLPDGAVDTSDYPDLPQSWFCTRCHTDSYSDEAKADHDRWCQPHD